MKKILTTFFVLCGLITGSVAQGTDCDPYYIMTEGAEFTLTSYDKKHRETGSTRSKISEVTQGDNYIKATIESSQYDDDGEVVMDSIEYEVECRKGNFYIDMTKFMDSESMSQYQGMEVEIESEELEFPTDPQPGQELGGGDVKVSIKSGGINIMKITTKVEDRKVEAIEEVTVPAGTFECVKISYTVNVKAGFVKKTVKAADWYAMNVGLIKSESYKKNGKLQGSTELTELKKP